MTEPIRIPVFFIVWGTVTMLAAALIAGALVAISQAVVP